MDILNKLFELNDTIILQNIAGDIFSIESDDEDEDIEYLHEKRREFIRNNNKIG